MRVALCVMLLAMFAGCQKSDNPRVADGSKPEVRDEVTLERSKLPPEDKTLVEAQEWCVVNSDERLGSMGLPVKLDVQGQAVFVCCRSCKRKAEANPEKTLARVAELKAKAQLQKSSEK